MSAAKNNTSGDARFPAAFSGTDRNGVALGGNVHESQSSLIDCISIESRFTLG